VIALNKFILIAALLSTFVPAAHSEEAVKPRNIRIDVEFKEYGQTQKGVLSADWRDTKHSQYTKQFILVSDGRSASIFVGEKVPYVNYYITFLRDSGYIEADVTIKEIGTKLQVTPKIVGYMDDMIEVTLTPQISFMADKKHGVVDIKTLSTTVIAHDGQSIEIGGLQKDAEFDKYFFHSASQGDLKIILTPHIR
jgi:type II secretory pathway component HofQ